MGCASSKGPEDEQLEPDHDSSKDVLESVACIDEQAKRRRSVAHQAPEVDGRKSMTTFDTAKIGVLTRHGIAPTRSATGVTAKAKINQDRGVVCWPFNGSQSQALLCIFDGHGIHGERVSEWCMNQIPTRLEGARDLLSANPSQALSEEVSSGLSSHMLMRHMMGYPKPCAFHCAYHLSARLSDYPNGSSASEPQFVGTRGAWCRHDIQYTLLQRQPTVGGLFRRLPSNNGPGEE